MVFSNSPVTGQLDYSRYMSVSLPGKLSGMGTYEAIPFLNDVGTVDTYTITAPASPVADTEYYISINGNKAIFKADASPTQAEVATGLYNAFRMAPAVYRLADVAIAGNDLTVTARVVGTKLAVVAPDSTIVNGTTPSIANVIPFGRFVGRKTTYRLDQRQGTGSASLIDANSGYEVIGVTMATDAIEKVGIGPDAIVGYPFGDSMNVLIDTGTYRGIWVECVESDIVIGDTPYVAVAAGNEGKLTKTSSGNVNISSKAKIVQGATTSFGTYIALVKFTR